MRPDVLLIVLHPRRIAEAVEALVATDIDKCWLERFSEWELRDIVPTVIANTGYGHYMMVSDDGLVTQAAIDRVLAIASAGAPAVTGYSNLDQTDPRVNITKSALRGDHPDHDAYGEHYTREEAASWPSDEIPTGFTGMSLTTMPRDLWLRFPFDCYGTPDSSWGSDFSLSVRLRDAGIPVVAARGAFVWHIKTRVNQRDTVPGRELLVGQDHRVTIGDVPGGPSRYWKEAA